MKPARYIGTEPGCVVKRDARVRFALCYPDAYEIGMSYYGFFLLYEIANRVDDVWCERVFAPWPDMEAWMRETRRPLSTLESGTTLQAMDLVGFSLSYELNVTNLLNMLELSGIPLRAAERENSPIVVGGGPLMLNPKPYEAFFDLVFVGEADLALVEMLERMKELKGRPRGAILDELSRIDGVYAPGPGITRVTRQYVADLDAAYHAVRPPVPVAGSVHDRFNLEISRGCGNGCRFCEAGYGYRPYRERSVATLESILAEGLHNTGHEEVSLLSLSSGDYSGLLELMSLVRRRFPHLSLSLPSLKIGSITEGEIALLGEGARGGFTFALEASTADLRSRLNKNIEVEALMRYLPLLKQYGWRVVKLYLMVGFPWETEDDLCAVREVVEPIRRQGIAVNLSVSPFTPRPQTPFQWLAMEEEETLQEKCAIIKTSLRKLGVNLKVRDLRTSLIEAIIARGDERLTPLFEYLHERGMKFEAWGEHFNGRAYEEWFEQTGMSMGGFLGARDTGASLPWDFIDTGVDKAFLREEMERAGRGEYTVACLEGCAACGLSCERMVPRAVEQPVPEVTAAKESGVPGVLFSLRYRKCGSSRYIGHLDAMSLILRAFRASGVRLGQRGKYHPKPKISLSPAIPVGVESVCEFIEIELDGGSIDGDTVNRINAHLPEGMKVLAAQPGTLKEMTGEHSYLLVAKAGTMPDATPWHNGRGRRLYLWKGKNVKELWLSGDFERIVKVDDRRIHGVRTDY